MYNLPQDLVVAVINYLAEKPYKETYLLLGALTKLTKQEEVTPVEEVEEGVNPE